MSEWNWETHPNSVAMHTEMVKLREEIERLRNACLMYDRKLHEKDLLIDACQKDAEIWRWVVGGQTLFTVCEWVEDGGYGHFAGVEEVEDAILAAMKEQRT